MDDAKAIKDDCCQISFSVEEKNSLGTTRKIPATDLSNYLNQNVQKQQLANMGITKIFANVKPDSEQLQEYLKNPPSGIDPRIWKQAQEDNPNPDKFLPIPVIGFNQLKWRLQIQEEETALHRAYLDQVMDDITTLKQKQTAAIARIAEHKRKYLDLQHRVLKVIDFHQSQPHLKATTQKIIEIIPVLRKILLTFFMKIRKLDYCFSSPNAKIKGLSCATRKF